MSTEYNRGYVGFLLLTMVAVVVAVGSFLLYERDSSKPAYVAENPPQEVESGKLQSDPGGSGSGVSNVSNRVVGYGVFTGSGEKSGNGKNNSGQLAFAGGSSSLDVSSGESQSQKNIETKKEVTPGVEKGVAFFNTNTDTSKSATKILPTIKKSTPQPIVTETISEPTLVVTKGTQPTQTLLLADARRVPFTVVEMTAKGGDITVDSLEITRMGLASDHVFVEVGVMGLGNERGLNSNHIYTMREAFTIKNGETQEIILYGNITDIDTLAEYQAQMPSLALTSIHTNAKVSGDLPIVGTTHIVNSSLIIGSLTLGNSGFDPGSNRTLYINSKNVIFSAVRADVGGSEPVKITEFSFTQNGSASPKDLSNVQICLVYKGSTDCTNAEVDETNKYFTADFENPVTIGKGEAVEVYIKGDVGTTGSNRTIDFDITTSYDVIAYGTNYKNYIYSTGGEDEGAQPEGSFSTSEYPFYNGYAHTISGGAFGNIGK